MPYRNPPPELKPYIEAKQRCTNPHNKAWSYYGGRGIEFRFNCLSDFIAAVGPKPADHYLDRIDPNGHYEAGNLRWVTPTASCINQRRRADNISGFRGVGFHKLTQKWRAQIQIGRKWKHLGLFGSREDAAVAYDSAAIVLHGEYAVLNHPTNPAPNS